MTEKILALDHIQKTYPAKNKQGSPIHALREVSLTVSKYEFVSIVGASGSGKSTLLSIAAGLLKPDQGTVRLNDQDLYTLSIAQRAVIRSTQVGFVFQQFHLVPYLTVEENIALTEPIDKKNSHYTIDALLERFTLSHRRSHHPAELSVGEQQRVALARAVYGGAPILFADEPTGNLDTENATIVLDFMKEFVEYGGAVLMCTHDQRASQYSSHEITLIDGRHSTSKS